MKTWFERLSIQNKLFAVFAVTILFGVLSAATNVFILVNIRSMEIELARIYQRAGKAYQAETLLQNLELAQKSLTISHDLRWADEFTNFSNRLDEYLREALLDAKTSEEKEALYKIELAKQNYVDIFSKISIALSEEDQAAMDELARLSEDDMSIMIEQAYWLGDLGSNTVYDTEERLAMFQSLATIIASITIISFLVSSIIAALVIHNQLNRPVARLSEAVTAVEELRFKPETLQEIAERQDEMGRLAQEFIQMAAAAQEREAELNQQANEIRAKIK